MGRATTMVKRPRASSGPTLKPTSRATSNQLRPIARQKCFAIVTFSANPRSMLSLKKLFGKDDKFFDLLEAGAEEAKASVDLCSNYLKQLADSNGAPGALDDFV